jgi:hypothetical protein
MVVAAVTVEMQLVMAQVAEALVVSFQVEITEVAMVHLAFFTC